MDGWDFRRALSADYRPLMLQRTARRAFACAFGMVLGFAEAHAQCTTQWQPGEQTQLAWSPNDTFAVDLPATTDATEDEMLGMAAPPPADAA